ncbi:hypothetical protein NDU88_002179 [Pleurodeles waltl]|uniref:Uncharacterized protein n=1 Tax=Pleurodeles waltl TaxID=8319 RepID=A0AAV7Q597_PLEWA|nr:hypothetical protein NDU88_002179 [Pleurodeles waltl]
MMLHGLHEVSFEVKGFLDEVEHKRESCNHGTDGWGFRKKSVTGDCLEEEENLQLFAEGADVGSEMEMAE